MGLPNHDREINGAAYRVTVFPGRKGFKLQARLVKFVAPLMAGVSVKPNEGGGMLDASLTFDGAQVVNTLLANLQEDAALKLVMDLLETTFRNEKPLDGNGFDDAFSSNYGELAQAVTFAIEANGFFGLGLEGGGLSSLFEALKFRGNSIQDSGQNGSSGES